MIESALPPLFNWRKSKKIWFLFFICLAMLNVTGCDYINNKLYPTFKANEVKTKVQKPPFARKNTPPKISIDSARDISDAAIENDSNFTVNPVALKKETANPKGVNTSLLFSKPVQTDEERFARIENRVQHIADTLNKMSPAITKLIGIENELDSLTFQLEKLISKGKLDNLITAKNESKQAVKQETKPSKTENYTQLKEKSSKKELVKKELKKSNSNKVIYGDFIHTLRLGDHPNKTRIVFETTENLDYTVEIDNTEKLMTITFPKGNIGSNPNVVAHFSNLIKSITQNKNGDGTILAFELTQNTQKLKEGRIPPGAENLRHRIFIDLKR